MHPQCIFKNLIKRPQAAQHEISRDRMAGVAHQNEEYLGLCGSQGHDLALYDRLLVSKINCQTLINLNDRVERVGKIANAA